MDLRKRVAEAWAAKVGTQGEIAKRFRVSLSWVQKLLSRQRKTGSLQPLAHGGGRTAKFTGKSLEALQQDVVVHPDASLQELLDRSEIDGSIMAVQRALERLGCHRKKSRFMRPSRRDRT
jgi:transposase